MNSVTVLKRKIISLTFSRDFESILLAYPSSHVSLTDDLERAVIRGLQILDELEDVRDLQHVQFLSHVIQKTNTLSKMDAVYFSEWKLPFAEEILDEVDLVLLTHDNDLRGLGLQNCNQSTLIILLAIAGCSKT